MSKNEAPVGKTPYENLVWYIELQLEASEGRYVGDHFFGDLPTLEGLSNLAKNEIAMVACLPSVSTANNPHYAGLDGLRKITVKLDQRINELKAKETQHSVGHTR